jgi:organic radical activating enzyme
MLNNQNPEKVTKDEEGRLDVHSIFYTIQGEGPFAGTPSIFVRLAGCNLQCPKCDTEYTDNRKLMAIEAIGARLNELWPRRAGQLIVITGGEPFRQTNLGNFVTYLRSLEYTVQIETNGTLYVPGPWSETTIVCSPKTSKINEFLGRYIKALKYVVDVGGIDSRDGLPLQVMGHDRLQPVARPPAGYTGLIYLQPLDEQDEGRNQRNKEIAIKSCLLYGHRLCLQLHKMLDLP